MLDFIFLIIFPVLIAITIFLFNIGIKEMVDGKYGFNNKYIESMSYVIIGIFLLVGFLVLNNFSIKEIKTIQSYSIILPGIIYFLMFYFFTKEKESVFIDTKNYNPNYCKSRIILLSLVLFIIITTILIFLNISKSFSKEILIKYMENDNMIIEFLTGVLGSIIIPYALMVLAAGYIYNYSSLFGFIKQELIFSEEGKAILDLIYDGLDFKNLEAYIFIESDEYTTLKINNKGTSSIRIKSEYIVARKFIHKI